MNKDDCKKGLDVMYFPSKTSRKPEFGVVKEIHCSWAYVLYEGTTSVRATRYEDLLPFLVKSSK